MNILFSTKALRDYKSLSLALKKIADKQLDFLLGDLRHPSLRAKKYKIEGDVWQARINQDWRFYFRIKGDTYHIVTIIKHPK
ncbi:MAG: hypothetical protein Q8P07_00835 [bacterium]|nr:hypothetical protein [bacterium]